MILYQKCIKLYDYELDQVMGGLDYCAQGKLNQDEKEAIKEGIKRVENEWEKLKTRLS